MGMGHVEINATKALSKVLYPVMLKRMGQLFGFKTSKAQDYLQRGMFLSFMQHIFLNTP